ncbi:MAG TPA: glycoside hydrolase [Blastocatellia bacterium]|nr:glycoside hydrolase [Blastocatellia bacterium]
MNRVCSRLLAVCCFIIICIPSAILAQPFDQKLYQSMKWRCIGPHRGGRTVGAVGVPGQPNVFYIGVNNGGVWRTDDYGRTWQPIFDDQPTGSIGAIAVAPSNPEVIYVGSGEGLQRPDLSVGDGIYKSTDTGRTWQHLGLRDGQQIGAIIVDPKEANRLFVAVLGHPYGANEERGVYRSTNGGQSFEKVLYKDVDTGAMALAFDPTNAQTVYADLWSARQGPWENGQWQGPGSGLYKSTDGGATWRQLTKGVPTFEQGLGRIGFSVAPANASRLYATVDAAPQLAGLYTSDDAGESWRRVNEDPRLWGRGSDFAEVKADPKDANVVYVANVSTYKSTDGGVTFSAWKGAPGGDDYHTIWINPDNSQVVLLASDQGAVITVNGGRTWSSWYNQPTAQFYHVITDNQFPYWVYGGQQESGSAGVASRGNDGQITFREWHPVGVEEYGYVAPDPLNPNIIYGGKASRYDRTTGQTQNIAPEAVRSGKYRFLRTTPIMFSPVDPHVLYLAGNVLFKTTNGGQSWDVISPDLTREQPDVPASIGVFRTPDLAKMQRRGVIYALGPSYKDGNTIWAGTDDGLVHITRDGGKSWQNVTPPQLTAWSKVSQIDASHFDSNTAYIAVNRIRLDDSGAHIYRTRDGGKTWTEIVRGLPADPINTVREDPVRPGLLFCGSERAVFVSFNDGDDWQPLRLNMPASSIRDLVVHNDDVVVGTHGRSFWILDDITPLRQISAQVAASDAHLFAPQVAYRVKRDTNTDTPLPPEEPAGQNPPDGAIINYYLKAAAATPITLEIFDRDGKLVRRFASNDQPEPVREKELAIPTYWIRPPQRLATEAGMQRFVWDLHYPPPPAERRAYPISAIYRDTPSDPHGPAVLPGSYTVKLTVGGKTYTQPLVVKIDPRVSTPMEGLAQQFRLSMQCYEGLQRLGPVIEEARQLRGKLKALGEQAPKGTVTDAATALDKQAAALAGGAQGFGRGGGAMSLSRLQAELTALLEALQAADVTPTTQVAAAVNQLQPAVADLAARWEAIKSRDLKTLNEQLRQAGLKPLTVDPR